MASPAPNFDWQRYEQAEAKTYKTFVVSEKVFGVDPKNRRLGGVETPPPPQPKRTIKIKSKELEDALPMEDKAILETGKALMLTERSSKDDFIKAVQVAYSAGKGALNEPQRNAVALVAWSMGLDPSPGVGHLYAWSDNQGFHIFIGYQGWITKARQTGHEFIYTTRVMTADERQAHGLNETQIGAICELYDMKSADMWKRIGLPPKPIVGSAKADPGEAMPRGRTRLWVAEKRAIVDAIKKMGVSFGAYTIQPIDGMQWSVSGGEYIASEGALAPTPEQIVEGVYDDIEAVVTPAQNAEISIEQTTTQPVETPKNGNSPAQVAIVANTAKPTREPMNVETLLSTFADRIEKQHTTDDAHKALVGDDETRGKDSISAQFKRFLGEACKTTISVKTQVLFYQALFGDGVDSSKKMTLGMWTVLDQWMNSPVNRSVAMQEASALFDHLMKPTLAQTA